MDNAENVRKKTETINYRVRLNVTLRTSVDQDKIQQKALTDYRSTMEYELDEHIQTVDIKIRFQGICRPITDPKHPNEKAYI